MWVSVWNELCQLMCGDKVHSFFSVLHVAVGLRKRKLVSDLLQLIEQLPPTDPHLINAGNDLNQVSDMGEEK